MRPASAFASTTTKSASSPNARAPRLERIAVAVFLMDANALRRLLFARRAPATGAEQPSSSAAVPT
jgi:hypothetical protein